MAYAKIASVSAGSSDGGNTATTASIDTTGADFIVVAVASYAPNAAPALTDSKGNDASYTGLTLQASTNVRIRLFYIAAPIVGTGHTFTASVSQSFPSLAAIAFSGAHGTPADQQNGATTAGAISLQPGSVTPTQDNELLIAGLGVDSTGTSQTIDGTFTDDQSVAYSSGQHFGVRLAYLIQVSAAAANPTWSWTGSDSAAAVIATFKAAGGGGGGTPFFTSFGDVSRAGRKPKDRRRRPA